MSVIAVFFLTFSSSASDVESVMERMIVDSESRAIVQLKKLISKSRDRVKTADLNLRLAELYTRRAKSRRFFEFNFSSEQKTVTDASSRDFLNQAIQIYDRVSRVKKYPKADLAVFNSAFVAQQLGKIKEAEHKYFKLIRRYPKSEFYLSAQLALGEISYDRQQFKKALEHYAIVRKHPESQAYPYAVYKTAWSLYNRQQAEKGIAYLEELVKTKDESRFFLREESLRDLTLFFGEVFPAERAYPYFKSMTSEEELATSLVRLAKLYDSHSRYRDIRVFLTKFIEHHPESEHVPQIHEKLIWTHDVLKDRKSMMASIHELDQVCQTIQTEDCRSRVTLIAKKLIKKWKKKPLENLFLIVFRHETNQKELAQAHMVYAGIQYKKGEKLLAMAHYLSCASISTDLEVQTDSWNSAITAKIEYHKGTFDPVSAQELADHVNAMSKSLPENPGLENHRYQTGLAFYQAKVYASSLEWLLPIASKNSKLSSSAQDIVLDIYNAQKDYPSFIAFAQSIQTDDSKRQQELDGLIAQAEFASIRDTDSAKQRSNRLQEFASKYQGSDLGATALIDSIKMARENAELEQTAELCWVYAQSYPDRPESKEVLKESVFLFEQLARPEKAMAPLAELVKKLPNEDLKLKLAGFYIFANQDAKAIGVLRELKNHDSAQDLLYKISSKDRSQIDQRRIEQKKEPYYSQSRFQKVKLLYDSGQAAVAFQAARKLIAQSKNSRYRAKARLLQAQILIDEFKRQSVKSRAERFALVLSLKSEKYEKAQKALVAVGRMGDAELNAIALKYSSQIADEFARTLTSLPQPKGMPTHEFQQIQSQLSPLVESLAAQRAQYQEQRETLINSQPIQHWSVMRKTLEAPVKPAPFLPLGGA